MSKCDLSIQLDQPSAAYHPGDEITGRVEVLVDADCRCDGLSVALGWHTHGKGNDRERDIATDSIFAGEWRAGGRNSYPFSFTVPDGPFTYHGHYLNVDWRVRARADIPWALDPKAEAEIGLSPASGTELKVRPAQDAATADAADSRNLVIMGLFGAVFAGAGSLFVLTALRDGEVVGSIFASVFAVVGLVILFAAVRRRVAEMRLGKVRPAIKAPAAEGEPLSCSVEFLPTRSTRLNGVTAKLRVYEEVVRGSGTDRTTYTEELYTGGARLPEVGRGVAGHRFEAKLDLPAAKMPFSFATRDNELNWSVEIEIDVAGWPDWCKSFPMVAAPADRAGAYVRAAIRPRE